MRRSLDGLSRFLATARVAKHRLFAWVDATTLPDSQIIAFARDDDYFFGVLHSRAHELWALRMGTFLGVGNDPRYTPTTCFETFPFPEPTEEERVHISEAELKKRTLTNLYNARPSWLNIAHKRLDEAVFAAYGWPAHIPDEYVLKNLLGLNLQRSGANAAT